VVSYGLLLGSTVKKYKPFEDIFQRKQENWDVVGCEKGGWGD